MKILVVDDSKAMRMIVARNLRQAGLGDATIVEAGNGVEGLAAVHADQPDLILSDWNMPEMSGIEFLHAVRDAGVTEGPRSCLPSRSTPRASSTCSTASSPERPAP
jgi:two-component system chemotaxis response regulator CheY